MHTFKHPTKTFMQPGMFARNIRFICNYTDNESDHILLSLPTCQMPWLESSYETRYFLGVRKSQT